MRGTAKHARRMVKRTRKSRRKRKVGRAIMRMSCTQTRSPPCHSLRVSGKDSSESESISDSEQIQITPEEKMRVIGLGVRDLRLGTVQTMAQLKARQVAYSLAGCFQWLLPSDVLETGGELEPGIAASRAMVQSCMSGFWLILVCQLELDTRVLRAH